MAVGKRRPVSINGILFDALLSEDREYEASVPEYAVEDGYSVSDNISLNAEKLSMTLFVSDTPLKSVRRGDVTSEEVAKELEDLYYSRKVCIVKIGATILYDMGLTSLTISRSPDIGGGREAKVSFTKIQKTKAKTAEVPAVYGKSGASLAAAGTANTSTGTAETTDSSGDNSNKTMLAGIVDLASDGIGGAYNKIVNFLSGV